MNESIVPLEKRVPAPRQDNQDQTLFGQTPSQTVGPFFHYGLPWKGGADLVGNSDLGARPELFPAEHYVLGRGAVRTNPEGERIEIIGIVRDAAGEPVPDAMVEIWQADARGRYPDKDDRLAGNEFCGFGRSATSDEGEFRFLTIKPGRVPGPRGTFQAPHIAMSVFARGVLARLATRLYFEGSDGLADDPVLACVPAERRETLVATPVDTGKWRFDINLGGSGETAFFAL
ncbi:protocatechuate 3,4-dioxygenase subunit alpha [Aurantiacibacter zhengii]|uniref:Protocatechuate 3,4-dioxygenase subunit alpha n=2 Tax=Aurantiacibacter zhengii TaxID=2307003 RepID=A0A418NVM2_9SPHN|nr:protocatechuate 3,4-dioxygenase subunit alpha [Aurantiacibacter zhengii]